ncbi:MAG: hypothetical protein VYE73_14255 [Acidobacteriota bacterium]|nr:hypothetical protein [Acidobacteriota bacterium]
MEFDKTIVAQKRTVSAGDTANYLEGIEEHPEEAVDSRSRLV